MNNQLLRKLENWENQINDEIDDLIIKRRKSDPEDVAELRYVIKKLEVCVGALQKAEDKIVEKDS